MTDLKLSDEQLAAYLDGASSIDEAMAVENAIMTADDLKMFALAKGAAFHLNEELKPEEAHTVGYPDLCASVISCCQDCDSSSDSLEDSLWDDFEEEHMEKQSRSSKPVPHLFMKMSASIKEETPQETAAANSATGRKEEPAKAAKSKKKGGLLSRLKGKRKKKK